MPGNLSSSIQYLKSIGPKRAESFASIGINTIRDLLFYFPTRYLDRTNILTSIKVVQYVVNGYEGEVTIVGQVVETELHYYNKKQIFKVQMKDNTGFFECIWFQGAKFFKDVFHEGNYYAISAKPVVTRYGHLQFVHPDFDRLAEAESKDFLNTGKIIPFYRLPKQLKESNIGDFSLRRIINSAVEQYANEVEETLPANLITENNLAPLTETIKEMHFPTKHENLERARSRFKFDELFYFECLVALRKQSLQEKRKGFSFKVNAGPLKIFLSSLSYELTQAQLKVLHEIRKDLESDKPMNRMLQGDVGSGKTIVAVISMMIIAQNSFQAVLMVPTEILCDQHFKRISQLVSPFGIKVAILISGQKKKERENILQDIKAGTVHIIIGTHALIEENVVFHKLGLVVIDEQHRFGVLQRSTLVQKGLQPDVLIMTATPIPRTLSMTLYGDLDISVIDEMPKNRIPVKTILRGENKFPEICKFIIEKAKVGYQSFIVYPLVEESEKIDLKAATKYFEELQNNYLQELKIGLVHGRMSWQEKEIVMNDFASKKYDVLVSTTVIEVGIDIPDANIIVINDSFRFGLSQLHQLRGRVGRSGKQAYCILVTQDELAVKINKYNYNFDYLSPDQIEKHKTSIRLNAMIKYNSGFDLSEIDLKLRGPGNIFSTQQSGIPEFKFVNIISDVDLISKVKEMAFEIINNDPALSKENNLIIRKNIKEYFSSSLHLSHIA